MPMDARSWFARLMKAGLEHDIIAPEHVLAHATPEVLAQSLPPPLMAALLQASLTEGAMTPDSVLKTITPEAMAEHLPHGVLWSCALTAADKAGMTKA
jgi:hypothetical protein